MTGFVTVRLSVECPAGDGRPVSGAAAGTAATATAGLCVVVRWPTHRFVLSAVPGRAGSADPWVDEHFAADADSLQERRRLPHADVVRASRRRPAGEALRWLADATARHPAAGLAAAPLAGGGWVVAGGGAGIGARSKGVPRHMTWRAERRVTVLAGDVSPAHPLFPSCLHAWLVAGGSLDALAHLGPAAAEYPARRFTAS